MKRAYVEKVFESFKEKKVLLIGDIMLDAYIWGAVSRNSPEAPVPVLDVTKREERLGGLANVALNVKSLGAEVILCTATGNDVAGLRLKNLFEEAGISTERILFSNERISTVKTRVINGHKHVIRIDEEKANDLCAGCENKVLQFIEDAIENANPDVILFEDYNKGVLTENVINFTIKKAIAKNIPTCVDPKKKNFFTYKNCTLFKPNLKEISEGLNYTMDNADEIHLLTADKLLREKLNHQISLFTLSEKGMFICDGNESEQVKANPINIVDVSGAGDTVISVAALCLAAGCDISFIVYLSNLAGGMVCEYSGVEPINKELLKQKALSV